MASPATLATAAFGSTIGGGIAQAMGADFKAKSEENAYKYQAGVAKLNKEIALQNADYERYIGEAQAQQSGMRTRANIGQTKVAQGASGLDVNSGSAVQVRDSQAEIGEFEQGIIRSNAARRAYGYEVEATGQEASKGMYEMSAKNARTAGDYGIDAAIISTVGSVASKWYQGSPVFGSGQSFTPSSAFRQA